MNDALTFDDFEADLPGEDRQLAALAQTIRFGNRFSLVFAVCNDIRYRETLIGRLQESLGETPTRILRLTKDGANLLEVVRDQSSGSAKALFVVGIEGWIRSGSEGDRHSFILNLNATRNAFPKAFEGTLVLWVPQYLLAAIHSGAPDFFSVRSGLYAFAPSERERGRLTNELTGLGWEETMSLMPVEKEGRIERMESLLAEQLAVPDEEKDLIAIARIHQGLSSTYNAHSLIQEGVPHVLAALEIRNRVLGERHLETLVSMGNLGGTYSGLGRHVDALRIKEETLVLMREVLGEHHPNTLVAMGNLATTYSDLNRHQDALNLIEETLRKMRELLGDHHPHTLVSMSILASSYSDLNRHEDALLVHEEVLERWRKTLGPRHRNTLVVMANLAVTLCRLGRYADALRLEEEALALSREVLGDRHPETFLCMSNLAITYRELGRNENAMDLLKIVVHEYEALLGADHPDTQRAQRNLATCQDTARLTNKSASSEAKA